MTDREKVIKGLEMHASGMCNVLTSNGREYCPYWENNDNCMVGLLKDALSLLKSQCEDEAASDIRDYCEQYESTYNSEDGSI